MPISIDQWPQWKTNRQNNVASEQSESTVGWFGARFFTNAMPDQSPY